MATLSAARADTTKVTWWGLPGDRLSFDPNPSTVTGGQGVATTCVTASGSSDIAEAYIGVTGEFNPKTGAYDTGISDPVRFGRVPGLYGIQIDKPYGWRALSGAPSVDPTDPQQRIVGQVQVVGPGSKQIYLQANPKPAAVSLWAADGETQLPQKDGGWYVTADPDSGVAIFLACSKDHAFFDLTAWNGDLPPPPQAPSASFVLARNNGRGTLSPPDYSGQMDPVPSDELFFQVTIPLSDSVKKGDQVALLLNDRVVWEGPVDPTTTVSVAYAALNLDSDGNYLSYVTRSGQQSMPAGGGAFPASGTALTGPGAAGALPLPSVATQVQGTVGPADVVGSGLEISIPTYDGIGPNDTINVYCYLSGFGAGMYTSDELFNVLAWTGTPASDLSSGKAMSVSVPQWAAAGYGNGQLQVNYQVIGDTTGTRWSKIAKLALNSTFSLS